MKIQELIDALSNMAPTLGENTQVKAWYLGNTEEVYPLTQFTLSGVSAGWCPKTQKPLAILKITP